MIKKLLFLSIAAFISSIAWSQPLNIQIVSPGADTTICAGDTVILQSSSALLGNGFNLGQIGVGWSSTQANPVFNNPCGPGPIGPHLWVGTTNSNTRTITTIDYDLTNGNACFVKFWMRYGLVPGQGNCEDPDFNNEGVHLQYSTNFGATWTDFPGPDVTPVGALTTVAGGGNTVPPFVTTTPGSGGYWTPLTTAAAQQASGLYHWNRYECTIPAAAISVNTRFRWAQLSTSSTGFDAWGIDEVFIGCTPANIIWAPTGTTTANDTVAPLDTTTYIVTVYDTLGNQATDTITLNVIPPPFLIDSIEASCKDSTFIITVDNPILCNSIAADGSDFRLAVPNGGPDIPIIAATAVNCQNGFTQTIEITSLSPLTYNGTFFIYVKQGFDFNTLVSACGDVPEFDTVKVIVRDCYEVYMDLLNVTVVNDDHTEVQWDISTDTTIAFINSVFEEYRIFRSLNPTGPYTQVGTVTNINTLTWEDMAPGSTSPLTTVDVNTDAYNYMVQAVYDGGLNTDSDSIASILLSCEDNADTNLLDLSWSDYWGWAPVDYYIMQRSTATPWVEIGNTNTTTTTITKPLDADQYTIKIETREPTTGALISESNYCTYDVFPKDARIQMPNVFSPNADNVNDYFNAITANDSTSNLVQFEGAIYNRWGTLLYEWTDWEIMESGWDGDGHSEGTYYYVVRGVGREGDVVEKSGFFMLVRYD